MAVLFAQHYFQAFDDDGNPLAGGKLYTYEAGTTTPKATYTTSAATVENANPVILDSSGRATVFIDGSYRFDLFDSNDVLIESTDNVTAFTTTGAEEDSFFESFSGDGETVAFTLSESQGTDEKILLVATEFEYSVNGDFDADSDWTKGTGWTIGSGVATASGAISTDLEQDAGRSLVDGRSYKITYTVTRDAGSITPEIGGTAGTARSSAGTYTETIIAGSTQKITFTTSGFTGTVDNVSVTEVDGIRPVSTSDFTINGTVLTFIDPPASGTGNVLVWNYARLAGAASASAAAAAASAAQAVTNSLQGGFNWDYSTTTTEADPGAGNIRFNNTTLSSATEVYISHTAEGTQDVDDWLATWDDPTSTIKGTLRIFKQAEPEKFAIYHVTNTETDNTTWSKFTIAYVTGAGTLTDGDTMGVWFIRNGDKGDTGVAGVVTATSGVEADTSAGASLISSGGNDCLTWGSGGGANLTLNSNMSGASTYKLVNMADPTSAQDYATKNYVDNSGGGSGLVLLGTGSASNSTSVDLESLIDGTYDEYLITFTNVIPVTDNQPLLFRTSTNNGSSYDAGASDYTYVAHTADAGSASPALNSSTGASSISLITNIGTNAGEGASGWVKLHGPSNASQRTAVSYHCGASDVSPRARVNVGFGERASAADVDAVRFLIGSGNIESGNFAIYGVVKS